jgi:hypothetical protein
MSKEEPLTVKFDKDISNQFFHVWHQTPSLRWRREYTNNQRTSYDKILQQMWRSDRGEEKWLDVPEED